MTRLAPIVATFVPAIKLALSIRSPTETPLVEIPVIRLVVTPTAPPLAELTLPAALVSEFEKDSAIVFMC